MYFGTVGSTYHTTVATRARFASGTSEADAKLAKDLTKPEFKKRFRGTETEPDDLNDIKPLLQEGLPEHNASDALKNRIKNIPNLPAQ